MSESLNSVIDNWPKPSLVAAEEMLDKYGEPDEISDTMAIWRDNGPWKWTTLYKEPIPHAWPEPHDDVLEQAIDFKVPVDKFHDIVEFDGSVIIERTKGEISARCGGEAMNFLAVNLAVAIANDVMTTKEARKKYEEVFAQYAEGKEPAIVKRFVFEKPEGRTADLDTSVGSKKTLPTTSESPQTKKTLDLRWKFKKGRRLARRLKFQDMDISIETDTGQYRHWYDPATGEKGSTKMKYPYGYIRRTEGADGEHVDVYIGPDPDARKVFVIRQMKAPDFKKYDEDKVMLGFESKKHAKASYMQHYNKDGFYGDMDVMSVAEFRDKFVNKALTRAETTEAQAAAAMPPPTVEDPYGVQRYLGEIPTMQEGQLIELAREIWGDDYQYKGVDVEHIRAELTGWLLDQRDLLAQMPMQPETTDDSEPSLSPAQLLSSGTSMRGTGRRDGPPPAVNSFEGV